MPGAQLYAFSITDTTIHTWDLARAIGADETLDSNLLEFALATIEPIKPMIAQLGIFGTGPSGDVPDSAPLQTRLLDLSGRRP